MESNGERGGMTLKDKFTEWFKGDAEAVSFAAALWDVAQDWDDLEDEGKTSHPFIAWLAFGKEFDPFMRRYPDIIRGAMMSCYLKWQASNVLDHEDVTKSYMLRAGIYDVWHLMAYLVGGHDWAVSIGPDIYRQYNETLDGLREELSDA